MPSSGTTTASSSRPAPSCSRRTRRLVQAYRLGERTWGVQFHPEVTRHMLDHWFSEGEAELPDAAARAGRRRTSASGPGTSTGGGSAEPSSTSPPGALRPAQLLDAGPIGRSRTTRARSRGSCAPRSRRPEYLHGRRRADARVAVRDDLGALRGADERPYRRGAPRGDERLHVDVPRAGRWPCRASQG